MAKATKDATERATIAQSGFKLLSLLTVGGVEKTDWRNLDKKDNVWDDLDATIEDLKDTLLLLKNDYFFDSIFTVFLSEMYSALQRVWEAKIQWQRPCK